MPDAVDAMAYDDALDLFDYWKSAPPMHEIVRLVGVGLGVLKPAARAAARSVDPNDPSGLGALFAANPNGTLRG